MIFAPLWLCLAALAACAAPPATRPPPAPGPQAAVPAAPAPGVPLLPPLPPAAVETESAAPACDDPAVSVATAALAAAAPPARPAALLHRARTALAVAGESRAAQGGPFGAVWPPAQERFLACCELALRDLDELIAASPQAPEAPEAIFTVGRVHDYPLLSRFDEALAAYRLTQERYPGTPWARRAGERLRTIEALGGVEGGAGPRPAPAR